MREIARWMLALTLPVALSASPALARTVTIQTAAPLSDRSDRSIDEAIKSAVDDCVRGATAMGLSSISLEDAVVLTDRVVVKMLASDDDLDTEDEVRVLDVMSRTALDRSF